MRGITELSILRPDDLVALDFELVNLRVSADGKTLVPEDESAEAFVVVTFPPQAMAETVVTTEVSPTVPPLRTALAGPSRLVFRLPAGQGLPLTTEALLAWNDWTPVVAPTALPRDTPGSAALPERVPPTDRETAVEFPWRLLLSPVEDGRWHTGNGASLGDVHQLWSAVLATDSGRGGDVRVLTALAGPDPGFLTSLSVGDREQIARLSSDFHLPTGDGTYFTPVPLAASRLELTALGANAELEAGWDYPEFAAEGETPGPTGYVPLSLRQYMHIAALGRDTLVRTVKAGYLCPTGHRAVVIESVERLPEPVYAGGARGVLVRTAELVVQQPLVDYLPLSRAFARAGREFPFTSVRLTTTSARIAAPESVDGEPFWLSDPDDLTLLGFRAVGLDVAGHALDLSLPLMFVPSSQISSPRAISFAFAEEEPITVQLNGQSMAVAAEAQGWPGPTTLKIESLDWSLELPPGASNPHPDFAMQSAAPAWYVPCFVPRIAGITASVPAVDELLGTSSPIDLTLDSVYLEHGFEAVNRAQVFVSLTSELPLELSPQRGGGLASPALSAKAVSRTLGPVSAPDKLQAGQVDVAAFTQMKLLGTIALKDLLDTQRMDFTGGDSAGAEVTQSQLDQKDFVLNPPRLTSRRLPAAGPEGPEGVETRFLWKPPLATQATPLLDLTEADLLLDATTRKVHGQEAVTTVNGRLRGAKLTFAGALSARIEVLAFRSESGKKVDVEARNVVLGFEGPLEFVDTLRQSVLPPDGFTDPPFLTVDSQGVVSGYTLGVPSVSVGVVSVQNIAVTAALSIPFTDRPAGMRFAISERHKPFLVTVSLFGGGGFFAVEADAKGLEQVEASIEFGGSVSLNLGVASGGVSVMAGIYFGMKGASVELTGYLRCGGYLEVLGLISVSLEFYLAFTYRKKNGSTEVWGQASLTVRVKIAFISKSVTVSVERHFAGSGGDPTFQQCFSPTRWAGYLEAFA
jgi:hypothetical protein